MTPENPASEQLLRGNELFLRAFMENSPTMAWCKDEEGRYVFLSPHYERHFGVTLADRLGKTDFELWPKTIAEEYRKNDLAVLAAGKSIDFVESAVNPDGTVSYWLNNKFTFRDASGRRYVGGVALDITERKKLEDELEKFRLSVEHLGDSVFWVNREGRILYTNESGWKTRGYTREEILNISIFDLDPDCQEGVWSAHFEDLKKRGTVTLETRHRTKGGRLFPIEVNANYVCIGGQEFNFATVRDITFRREAEVRMFEDERRLRAIFEQAGVGVIEAGTSANLLRVNKYCCQMLGYSEEELLSKTMADLTHADDMPVMLRNWQLLLEGKTRGYSLEKRYIAKNGEKVWVSVIVSALWAAGKSPDRVVAIVQNITPQKKAEVALSESEFRYRTIFEQAGVGVAVLESRTGRFVEVNRKDLEILGRSKAELLATDFMSITHPDDLANDLNQRHRMIDGDTRGFTMEKRLLRPDGAVVWVSIAVSPLWRPGEEPLHHLAVLENITERKLLEQSLRLTQLSVDQAAESVFWMTPNGKIVYVNDAACRTLGYTREEIIGKTLTDIDANFPAAAWPTHWEDVKRRKTFSFETDYKTKDGRLLKTEVTVNYIQFEGREYKSATMRDITERKRAEEALANENKHSHLLAVLGRELGEADTEKAAALSVLNAAGKVLDWDCGWLRIWNATTQEWRDIVAFDLIDGVKQEVTFNGESMSRLSNIVQQALERPQLLLRQSEDDSTEILTVFGNGRRSLSLIFAPIRLGNQLIGMLSVQSYKHHAYDAAALEIIQALADHCAGAMFRLRYQESLRQSEVRFKTFFESAPEAIFVLATGEDAGRIIDANPFAEEIHGYARGELRGLRIQDLDLPADANLVSERMRRLGEGDKLIFEVEHFRKDGSIFPLEVHASLINLGNRRFILSFNRDMTERKKMDAALRAGENLAATGRMAAGIAHEINNPLNGIRASLHLVEKAVPANHPDFEFVKRIEREIDRIATITHRMFTLYKPTQDEAQEFSLKKLLEDVVYLSQPNAEKSGARLTYTAQVSECLVRLPEAAVSEVLYNLVKNAIEASPEGGEVTVTLSCVEGYALITIEDQGDGIPEELKDRVFEPFFTTKSGSGERGLGLGLATARSRVEAMCGHISFNPSKVQGTVFHVTLPIQLAIE